jgi:hypothetical protein
VDDWTGQWSELRSMGKPVRLHVNVASFHLQPDLNLIAELH